MIRKVGTNNMGTKKQELKKKALALPLLPGIYLMKDKEGSIIYVGKSKHLRKRVSSYFGSQESKPQKVERMVRHIADFDYQITDTELDALLLECQLIKQIKPIYNKLLKNDSRYRYIHLNQEKEVPFWESVYERQDDAIYLGPYDMKNDLSYGIEAVNKFYGLAQCKGKPDKMCCIARLKKECLAPCLGMNSAAYYQHQMNKASEFFKNENEDILIYYQEKMNEAAQKLDFERAQEYKKIWHILQRLTYREKAIAWSISKTKTIAFVPKPIGGVKVYFLVGALIIKTLSIKRKRILKQWFNDFDNFQGVDYPVYKEQIDEAYIIYNYLHRNNGCEYIELK